MTQDFFMISRYGLLDSKTQEGHLMLAQKPSTFHSVMGLCSSYLCFYFLDANEVNGIHVFVTIEIQKPTKFQAMFQFNDNGLISMDAMFGTNNVKYHLFTLMVFDFHRTRVLVT
jgi:hypothetical protein